MIAARFFFGFPVCSRLLGRARFAWMAASCRAAFTPLLALLLALGSAQAVLAQTATSGGTSVFASINDPQSLASDASGNIYDTANGGADKYSPLGVKTQIDFNSSDLGIAVDSSGNVYVGQGNNIVNLSTGSVVGTVPGQVLNLAVDASGTIYAATYYQAFKVVPGQAPTLVAQGTGSEDGNLGGLAVDASGILYIAHSENIDGFAYVQELKPDGTTSNNYFGHQLYAAGGFGAQGVAVDKAGNIYLADQSAIFEYSPASGTTRTLATQYFGETLNGVALDVNGNVFFANQYTGEILRIAPPSAVNFGSVNVCPAGQTTPAPCTQTEQLTFTVTGTGVFGTPVALTQGATGLDFSIPAAGDTCVGAQVAGTTCTVNVTFAPTVAGARNGAVELVDASGNVLATTNVYGTGQGPQIAFNPGTQGALLSSGLFQPNGVAIDGSGNLFIADSFNNRVVKLSPGGTQTTILSNLSIPTQLAVDGAGDVFVADTNNNRVVEVAAGTGAQTSVGSGLQSPAGVAVDGAGNVFIADGGNNRVVEVPAAGGAQVNIGNGFAHPVGVAVDGFGDVFVADLFNQNVVEVPAGGGPQLTIGGGFSIPQSVAVDGAGDVFITDGSATQVTEVPAGGGAQFSLGSGLSEPDQVFVDAAGDLFIADVGNNRVVELNRSQAPTLSFAATPVGQTSTDSPMSTQIQNIGNQPLNAVPPGLEVGTNFAQVFGATPFTDCTSSFSLTSGQLCNLSIDFTPQQIGSIQTVAIFADNSLNVSPVTIQSVALNGTGTAIASTLAFNAPTAGSSYAYGQTVTAMASSNSSAAITYSVASGPAMQVGAATFQLTGVGQVTLQATQLASGNYAAGTAMVMFNAISAATTTTLTGSVASGATTGTLTAMVAPTNAGTYPVALTGSVTFYDSSTSPNTNIGTATLTAGKASITTPAYTMSQSFYAVYTGSMDYAQSQSNTVPLSFPVAPTITFTVANQSYGAAPFQVSASSNSQGAITYSVVSGPAMIAGSAVTLTGAGTVKLQASQAASGGYLAGSANSTFTVAQAATATMLSGTVNTGGTATLTASVAPHTAGTYPTALTGMVTFYNNGTSIGTATIAGGKATLTTTTYTGLQSFTAVYNGDTNYTVSPASNAVPLTFTMAPTITFTTAASYAYEQSFQLAATSNSAGTFTYSLVSGPATVSPAGAVTVTGQGKVTVQASEAAATGYTAGSKQTSFTAVQATTSTKLTATAVKSGYGSAASLTATVTPQFSGTPSGIVTFYDGSTKLATMTLSGGAASYTTSQLVGAQHSYSATYSGDTNFTGSPSNTAALTIPVTAVSLQLASTNLVYPLPPAFEIIVSPASGKPAPTGTVTVTDGSTPVGTYTLYALTQGHLIGLVLPPLNVGTHPLTAVYSGDANYAPGTSATVTVTVTPGPVKLSLSCQSTSLKLGQTLSCTVNADEGLLPVTGTVTYTVTGWGSGSVTLNKAGQATITYPTRQKGSFILTASYGAQGNYQAAASASVNFTVN